MALRICMATCLSFTASAAMARPPEIRNLDLRALQSGAATKLTMDGADLLPAPKFFLDDQPLEVQIDPASTAARVIATVTLPAAIPSGVGQLRLSTQDGFSNSLLVGVDRFPQAALTPELAAVNVAVHGSVPGSGVSKTTFAGKAGEEVILEVESRRLGSKLRPVIHLYDSRRVQVGWASASPMLAGDARIMVKLPKDDRYTVEVHDANYAPPGPSFFRLKIGQWQFADLAFPPAIPRGQEVKLELLGNVPGMTQTLTSQSRELLPILNPAVTSGLPPTVTVSTLPELIKTAEQPMNLPGVPVAVSGRLQAAGQIDRFALPVTPGTKLTCELFAERIGSRVDGSLEMRNKQGGVLAANDDSPNTTDPKLEFIVPADLDVLEITVRDQLDLGRPDSIYRLVITNAGDPQPGFDVVAKTDVVNSPAGETTVLQVLAARQNYDGPILLKAEGVPPGMILSNLEIPAGANGTLLTFASTGEAPAQLVTRLIAQTPDGAIERRVRIDTTPDDRTPPWMRERFALAATPKPEAPFQLAMTDEAAPSQLVLSSKPALALKITRPPTQLGPVRLSLLTSQTVPKINGQPNPALLVRAEKAVEIPVDNMVLAAGNAFLAISKQHSDAVQQAQAAQGDAKVAADTKAADLAAQRSAAEAKLREAEMKAVYQTAYTVIVPSVVGQASCDVSLRAELLNPERNVVLRTVYLPVKRLSVLNPLVLKLDGPLPLAADFDPAKGASIKLTAKIERLAGYQGDVTVTVLGLPPGVTAANAVVKADQTDFMTEIKVPANFAGTDLTGIKLAAAGPPDPLSGNISVKSTEPEVTIKLNRPSK